jgi:hypothetical protein
MASDKQQFQRATEKWEQLHDEQAYSVPPELGRTAILCSFYDNVYRGDPEKAKLRAHRDIKLFRKEALKIADLTIEEGGEVEVVLDAQVEDFEDTFKNPLISDVIVIGHGDLSTLWIRNPDDEDRYDWQYVSEQSDHLKTGTFTQRQCGLYNRDLAVPLGTFAMADHRSVIATPGFEFHPRGLSHPDNDLLEQISPLVQLSYDYIKSNYRYLDAEASARPQS